VFPLGVELFEDRQNKKFIIKDGESTLVIPEKDFTKMSQDGRSPLLKKLWDEAKKERQSK
jgi:hypothetical protein